MRIVDEYLAFGEVEWHDDTGGRLVLPLDTAAWRACARDRGAYMEGGA